jgi:hypothetical protein
MFVKIGESTNIDIIPKMKTHTNSTNTKPNDVVKSDYVVEAYTVRTINIAELMIKYLKYILRQAEQQNYLTTCQ